MLTILSKGEQWDDGEMPEKRHVLKLAKGPLSNWQSMSQSSGGRELLFPRRKLFFFCPVEHVLGARSSDDKARSAALDVSLAVTSLASHCFGSVQCYYQYVANT